jgi:sulfur-carrier protein
VATVSFTPNLERHVECPTQDIGGGTVRAVLDAVFAANPRLRGYVLDDQGALRRHMMVFVDGQQIQDREGLSDPVRAASDIYVMQALSGG